VILDVISAALTGVIKNNENAKRSFFIVLKIDIPYLGVDTLQTGTVDKS
jgi:hypothetical protein